MDHINAHLDLCLSLVWHYLVSHSKAKRGIALETISMLDAELRMWKYTLKLGWKDIYSTPTLCKLAGAISACHDLFIFNKMEHESIRQLENMLHAACYVNSHWFFMNVHPLVLFRKAQLGLSEDVPSSLLSDRKARNSPSPEINQQLPTLEPSLATPSTIATSPDIPPPLETDGGIAKRRKIDHPTNDDVSWKLCCEHPCV